MPPQVSTDSNAPAAQDCAVLRGEVNIKCIQALDEQIKEHEKTVIKLKRARKSLSLLPFKILGNIFSRNVTTRKVASRSGGSRNFLLRDEVDIESIQALDEQIKERETTVIKLKRARNSSLNVSRLPSEILGDIFSRNVTTRVCARFGGSHNFLLVCHHWFNVASCTPEVWSCWGETPEDWKKWCFRYPSAPLDLTLKGFNRGTLDNSLQNALRDRNARGNVRSIHLDYGYPELLGSIISSLTPNREEILPSGIRSIVFGGSLNSPAPVDVSEFLTHNRFSKLQRLKLEDCIISSWDPIIAVSQTSNFTTLSFDFSAPSPVPTMSQIRLILASNPTIQEFMLGLHAALEGFIADSSPLPLPNLRELELIGDLRSIFGVLSQLDHPRNMDKFIIHSTRGTVGDIPTTVGPYLRHYLQHHGRSGGLGLFLSIEDYIEFHVGGVGGIDFSVPEPEQMVTFVEVILQLDPFPPADLLIGAGLDLIAHVPQEHVLHLMVQGDLVRMGDASARLPNLRTLRFEGSSLDVAFPVRTPNENTDIYPSLRHMTLQWVTVNRGDWSPMTNFLRRRVDSRNRLDTLRILGSDWMFPWTSLTVEGLVREYRRY